MLSRPLESDWKLHFVQSQVLAINDNTLSHIKSEEWNIHTYVEHVSDMPNVPVQKIKGESKK